MNTVTCAKCNAPTEERALTMSLDGNGMVCPTCAIGARAVQEKRGMRKAYLTGAVIVGLAFLYVVARILVRVN